MSMTPEEDFFAALERQMNSRMTAASKTGFVAVYKPARIVSGALVVVAGFATMITAVALTTTWLGVAGFGVAFAGGWILSTAASFTRAR